MIKTPGEVLHPLCRQDVFDRNSNNNIISTKKKPLINEENSWQHILTKFGCETNEESPFDCSNLVIRQEQQSSEIYINSIKNFYHTGHMKMMIIVKVVKMSTNTAIAEEAASVFSVKNKSNEEIIDMYRKYQTELDELQKRPEQELSEEDKKRKKLVEAIIKFLQPHYEKAINSQ
ncbi:unnamed protein product [Rotaria sp. Silwood2]|nr:unnamed protein product [Rotaria sp. Silwood2]